MNVENGTPWKSTSVAMALPIRVMRTGVVGKMAEVRAIGGTTQHTEVCPFGQAEREDFFHGEVARELAEEILELAVRERLPTCGDG